MSEDKYPLITPREVKMIHEQRPGLTPNELLAGLQSLDAMSVPERTGFSLYDCFRLMNETEEILGDGGRISDLTPDQTKVWNYMAFAVQRLDEITEALMEEM